MNEFVYWAFCSVEGQNEEHRSFVKIFGGFQSAFIDQLPSFTKHLPRSCHYVKFRILRFFFQPNQKKNMVESVEIQLCFSKQTRRCKILHRENDFVRRRNREKMLMECRKQDLLSVLDGCYSLWTC